MNPFLRRSYSFLFRCSLASSVLVLASCGSTISSRQHGNVDHGTWVTALPSGYDTINVEGFTYYVQNGSYFIKKGNRFVSVPSPRSSLREKRKITGQFQGGMPQSSHHPGRRI